MLPFLKFALLPIGAFIAYRFTWLIRNRHRRGLARFALISFGGIATLELALSLAMGSIDISNLWDALERYGPSFLLGGAFVLCLRVHRKWLRGLLATISGILWMPAALFAFLACFAEVGCLRRNAPAYSPDGKNVVLVSVFQAGVFDDDTADVELRPSWWPFATSVYAGLGQVANKYQPGNPEVRWYNNHELLIRYQGGKKPRVCLSQAFGVTIRCYNPDEL